MKTTLAAAALTVIGVALWGVATPARAQHEPDWLTKHGTDARKSTETCATCHKRNSCLECHIGKPEVANDLPLATPEDPGLAQVQRKPPPSHQGGFRNRHGTLAAAAPQNCAVCHVRSDCLSCHRPDAASGTPGFHPADFLSRHPAAAYARQNTCGDCHNTTAFCANCHKTAGLVAAGRPLRGGYHDAKQFFLAGHGQAARQSLESCVACHAERDCLQCHSALGARRFNPHGPGFDPARLKQRNAEMCLACHVTVPGGGE
ncbi:MAG: hypothetical protein HYW06_14245 [Gemmatimonadetes bacterium]|nr:hypothetical protein [Gemmatimonadota bacterium]